MTTTGTAPCLGLYKAQYTYTAQGEDEVSMEEDQLVFLLDNSDDDWYRIRVKAGSQDAEGPEGLVPAAYLEKAPSTGFVKAIYDYEAAAPGELTISDGQIMSVYEKEDDWVLVEMKAPDASGKFLCGYVPANYVEESDGTEETSEPAPAPKAPAIIIPDSPPRPAYVAPEERSAAAHSDKTKSDPIETWSVSQVDKKGKKKKGTLGVGNGNVFFASESDKMPVQKWQTADISSVTVDKSKHVELSFANGTETLRFLSKDAAEAIKNKVEASRAVATGGASSHVNGGDNPRESTDSRAIMINTPRAMEVVSPPKAVHFAATPSEIPPRSPTPSDDEHQYANHTNGRSSEDSTHSEEAEGDMAVALYDFTGDATDELTVKEGEALFVLDRSNDDWWKCRNHAGQEGVVPAQYVELEPSDEDQDHQQQQQKPQQHQASSMASAAAGAAAARAAKAPSPEPEPDEDSEEEREREEEERQRREKEERKEKERKEKERKERERARAEREAAERDAREAEEQRIAAERKKAEEKKARAAEKAREEARLRKQPEEKEAAKANRKLQKQKVQAQAQDPSSGSEDETLEEEARKIALRRQLDKDNERQNQARPASTSSSARHGPPPTGKTRVWHDRSGQFRVEAEFKGFENGKIRLHKLNGVTIEVPAEKMSAEDMKYIAKTVGKDTSARDSVDSARPSVDKTIKLPSANVAASAASARSRPENAGNVTPKKRVDWFEFFLNAGCDMDDCTRYQQSFERDKIDETLLPDMKADTLRALGLREGDIIRVLKAIEKKHWRSSSLNDDPTVKEQIQADERYALEYQQAILAGKKPPPPPGPIPQRKPTSPPPNLFTGPGGTLKDNTRRGRPNAGGARTTISVDENTLANASNQLGTPTSATRSNRTPSPNLLDGGATTTATAAPTPAKPLAFDDDAWTPRPSSTNPMSPVVAVTPPVAPSSAPPAPAPAPPPAPSITTTEPPARPSTAGANPTTSALERELELLQKIAELKRPPSAPAPSNMAPAAPPVPSPSLPTGYTSTFSAHPGLSPSPSLQPQQTGFYTGAANGIRGPFAPVPANEPVLLKPLVPTNSALTGFVPTRPSPLLSQQTGFTSAINPFQPQPTGFQPQPTGFQPQLTGFQPQPTGFQSSFQSSLQPQPTGFQPFQPQPTGFQTSLTPLMTQATGVPFGMRTTPSPIPPVPPIPNQFTAAPNMFNSQPISTQPLGSLNFGGPSPSSPPANNSPANVFAAMKSGNFGGEQQQTPNYDALRGTNVNPLASQPTGWVPGMQSGYPYH